MPALRAAHLKAPYNLSDAHVHALLYKEDAVEMVWHDGGGQRLDLVIVMQLVSGDLLPFLHHRLPKRGEVDARIGEVHIELAEEVVAIGDHDGDQIDATFVVVVAIAMRAMGGGHGWRWEGVMDGD